MDRKFLEGLGLEKEAVDSILNQHGTELQVVKTRLTTSEAEVKLVRAELMEAKDKIAELEKVDVQELQQQLESEKAARVKDQQQFHLTTALTNAGCQDIDYVLFKLGDSVEFDETGKLKDEVKLLETVKKDYASQFPKDGPKEKLFPDEDSNNGGDKTVDWSKMSYEEVLQHYKSTTD